MTTMKSTTVPMVRLQALLTNAVADPTVMPMTQQGSLEITPGDYTVGKTAVERLPSHLLLILDMSGSMKGQRLSLLTKGLETIFEGLDPEDRLTVVRFGSAAHTEFANQSKNDIDNDGGFEPLEILGGTEYMEALREATDALRGVVSATSGESRAHQVLFLTDGGATDRRGNAKTWDSTIYGCVADMVSAGANFHTLGLGKLGDKHLKRLIEMTEAGLGQFFNAQTDEDVVDHLGQILGLAQEIVYANPELEIEVSPDVTVEDLGVAIKGLLLENHLGPGNHMVNLPDIRKDEIVELTYMVSTDVSDSLGTDTTLVRWTIDGAPTTSTTIRWNTMTTDPMGRSTKPITLRKTWEGSVAGKSGDKKKATEIGRGLEAWGKASGDEDAIDMGTILKEGKALNPAEFKARLTSTKKKKSGGTVSRKSKSTE